MKHLTKLFRATIAIAIMFCVALPTFAHDFEDNGIYYNYLDETAKTVEVTYKGSFSSSYSNEYTGAVTIPSSVTYNSTTYSVTTIGDYAFYNCTGLTSVTIPNSVISIGNDAFFKCSGLTSVTIPNSVTSIGSYAFDDCESLTEVNITDLSAWCKIYFGSYDANPLYYAKNLKLNGTEIKDLIIPNDITEIKGYAFYGCTGLTSVNIPNSVTTIGYDAFAYCSGLTSVTIPNSVTTIGNSAFYGCTGLTSVNIPNSVTMIGYYMPYAIGYNPFEDTGWYNNQPDGILYLDNCCLGYKGNEPTGTLSIKEGTRLIAYGALDYCHLAVLHLPKSVTYVGDNNCCADVCYCYNPTPPSGGGFTSYRLFVPKGSLMAYATAEGWKGAEQILEFEVDDVVKPILTIAYPEGGVIKQTVDNGEILMLQIVPANGWKCNSVTFNGIDVTNQLDANGNYSTPSITANSQLSIVFVKNDGSVANALVDNDIKVCVRGNVVTITGADEFSDVEIYNTAGTTIYTGIDKSITIDSNGIYILTVEGRTFKFAM